MNAQKHLDPSVGPLGPWVYDAQKAEIVFPSECDSKALYGHVNDYQVNVGQRVNAGQQIATVGNRGQSTGPHLHFEVAENGAKVDPAAWLQARGVAVTWVDNS